MIRNKALGIGAAVIIAAVGVGGFWGEARAGGEACRLSALRERLGPPLICHPFDIGDDKKLPFGKAAMDESKTYDAKKAVGEVLSVLKTERSTIVRMEALRRATIVVMKDRAAATELLAKISWKAMDGEASGKPDAEAWFDAGFLAACYAQMGIDLGWKPGVSEKVAGYAWVKRAIQLAPEDGEMQFAAALVTHPAMLDSRRDLYETHVRAAAGAMRTDKLLEINLRAHLSTWDESLEAIVERGAKNGKVEQADARKGGGN